MFVRSRGCISMQSVLLPREALTSLLAESIAYGAVLLSSLGKKKLLHRS